MVEGLDDDECQPCNCIGGFCSAKDPKCGCPAGSTAAQRSEPRAGRERGAKAKPEPKKAEEEKKLPGTKSKSAATPPVKNTTYHNESGGNCANQTELTEKEIGRAHV